jgi:hypothetical protein
MALHSTRIAVDDDPERIFDHFEAKGYTDGLPIIPPTRERVERMLAGTARRPDETLGNLPPANYPATIEKIAVNAVMAGCKPEYMPVLIAAVEVMLEPQWLLDALQSTTNPLTPMLIVNGPIRARIGLNCSTGVMGPGWRANATIGRAIRLILLNVGGAAPGDVDKCTQGFVGKYTLCIGENEEESAWAPFHTTRGFAPEDSVVTVVGVNASTNIHDSSDRWEDLLKTLTASLVSPGTANVADPHSTPVIALNPLHVKILADAGFSRERLQDHIFLNSRLPEEGLSKRRAVLRRGEHGDADFSIDGAIPFTNRREQILIVTTGGMSGGQSCYLPNGHYGYAGSKRIDTARA